MTKEIRKDSIRIVYPDRSTEYRSTGDWPKERYNLSDGTHVSVESSSYMYQRNSDGIGYDVRWEVDLSTGSSCW